MKCVDAWWLYSCHHIFCFKPTEVTRTGRQLVLTFSRLNHSMLWGTSRLTVAAHLSQFSFSNHGSKIVDIHYRFAFTKGISHLLGKLYYINTMLYITLHYVILWNKYFTVYHLKNKGPEWQLGWLKQRTHTCMNSTSSFSLWGHTFLSIVYIFSFL